MKKRLLLLVKLFCIFAILYDINFSALPGLTTSRFALLSLLVVQFLNKNSFSKKGVSFLVFLIILIIFSIFQFSYSDDFTQTSRLIWFSFYSIICPFILTRYISSKNEFFWLVSIAAFIQALITIIAYLDPAFKSVLATSIISTSNYDETNVMRAIGFASIGGASLSLIQTTGIMSILFLQRFNSFSLYIKLLLWVQLIFILISIVFIGRTGLVVSFFAIMVYILSLKLTVQRFVFILSLILLTAKMNFLSLIETVTKNIEGYNSELFVLWVTESFQLKNNGTIEILNNMPIPPLSIETIIGTGRVRDVSGFGNASGNDSGYIQTYYSLGLIASVLFYLGYLFYLLCLIKGSGKYALSILVLIVFMVELKEPFIFSYSVPFYILCTILLINKQNDDLTKVYIKENRN